MTVEPSGSTLATVTMLVHDYDEAITFFGTALGLELISDQPLPDGERFVVVGGGGIGAELLLARAVTGEEIALVGRQTAGRVGFFLRTSDFESQHRRMIRAGVGFHEEPRHEPYGTVAVFSDCYGNRWDLIEPV